MVRWVLAAPLFVVVLSVFAPLGSSQDDAFILARDGFDDALTGGADLRYLNVSLPSPTTLQLGLHRMNEFPRGTWVDVPPHYYFAEYFQLEVIGENESTPYLPVTIRL